MGVATAGKTGDVWFGRNDRSVTGTDVIVDTATAWTAASGAVTMATRAIATTDAGTRPAVSEVYNRATCASLTGAGGIARKSFTAVSLVTDAGITFYIRPSTAITAGQLTLKLCSDTLGATAVETLSLPALDANVFTRIALKYVTPANLTAIQSVVISETTTVNASWTLDFYDIVGMLQVGGAMNWSVNYAIDTLDSTDYQSGGTREFLPSFAATDGSFDGHIEGAPAIPFGEIVAFVFHQTSTMGKAYITDGFITSNGASSSFDALNDISYSFQGSGLLQQPIA